MMSSVTNGINAPLKDGSKIPTAARSRSLSKTPIDVVNETKSSRRVKMVSPAPPGPRKPVVSLARKTNLESTYNNKKKRYVTLEKIMLDKQKTMDELSVEMSALRKEMIASGLKDPGKLENPKLMEGVEKTDSKLEEISFEEQSSSIMKELIEAMRNQSKEISSEYEELCTEGLEECARIISWLTNFSRNDVPEESNLLKEQMEEQLGRCRQEETALKLKLDLMKTTHDQLLHDLEEKSKQFYRELKKSYNQRLESKEKGDRKNELGDQLNRVADELASERELKAQANNRRNQSEGQLQKARSKIREFQTRKNEDDEKIQQLQSHIKLLETQAKRNENPERIKSLEKSLKNGESLIAKVEAQRDTFESRLMELKIKMDERQTESLNEIQKLHNDLKILTDQLVEERQNRLVAENAMIELEERYAKVQEKSEHLCELVEHKKELITILDDQHSINEVHLFNELQTTRDELLRFKEMSEQLEREKQDFLKATSLLTPGNDSDESSKEQLLAHLVEKSNRLHNVMKDCAQFRNQLLVVQEKNTILERRFEEIQESLELQSKQEGVVSLNAHIMKLEQQMCDLKHNLSDSEHRNKEFENLLTHKQLEVEQRDRVIHEQRKTFKARDDLISLLEGRTCNKLTDTDLSKLEENSQDIERMRESGPDNNEISKELHALLEIKQTQVMRLENMVTKMEEQQDRAQAQRTRLECRIAELETTLMEKFNRKKGFAIL